MIIKSQAKYDKYVIDIKKKISAKYKNNDISYIKIPNSSYNNLNYLTCILIDNNKRFIIWASEDYETLDTEIMEYIKKNQ